VTDQQPTEPLATRPPPSLHRARLAAWLRGRRPPVWGRRRPRGASPAASWFGYERGGYACGADNQRPLRIHGRPPHLRLLPLASYTWRPRPSVKRPQLLAAAAGPDRSVRPHPSRSLRAHHALVSRIRAGPPPVHAQLGSAQLRLVASHHGSATEWLRRRRFFQAH